MPKRDVKYTKRCGKVKKKRKIIHIFACLPTYTFINFLVIFLRFYENVFLKCYERQMEGTMKKLLALFMITTLALTGCSKGTSSDKSDSKDITIKVGVEKTYMPYFEDVTKAYTKANPNVKFKLTETKMFDLLDSLEAQKGNSADVFMMPNDRIGDLADKKLITNIDADLSKYTKTAQTAAHYQDKNYFLPLSTDTTLLFYNKDLTTSIPKTLKELDPKDWSAKYTDFYVAAGLFYANGSYIFGKSNTDLGMNNAGGVKAGEEIKALYSSKVPHWEALKEEEAGYNEQVDNFVKGKLKYVIDGPWKVADFVKAGLAEDKIGYAPIPSWDGSHEYKPLTGTKGLGVNAYSKVKSEAVKFVDSLATKDNAEKWYKLTKEVNPSTEITYDQGSLAKTVLDATSKGVAMPTDPALGKVWEPMADALKQIANGKDVKKSLDSAVSAIQDGIKALKK